MMPVQTTPETNQDPFQIVRETLTALRYNESEIDAFIQRYGAAALFILGNEDGTSANHLGLLAQTDRWFADHLPDDAEIYLADDERRTPQISFGVTSTTATAATATM